MRKCSFFVFFGMLAHELGLGAYGAARVNAVGNALPVQFCPERVKLKVNFPTVNRRDLFPLKASR